MGWPSHADLIGKTMLLQFPRRIKHGAPEPHECPQLPAHPVLRATAEIAARCACCRHVHCPSSTRRESEQLVADECLGHINHVEHIRHPIQNCEANHCAYMNAGEAQAYARGLHAEAARFVNGSSPLPPRRLYQYARVPAELQLEAARAVLRPDVAGRICGVRTRRSMSRRPGAAGASR